MRIAQFSSIGCWMLQAGIAAPLDASALRETRERYPPIDDVASATSWWGRFGRDESVVLPSPARVAKIGRNDPCPCGSGKKYKKCCGR